MPYRERQGSYPGEWPFTCFIIIKRTTRKMENLTTENSLRLIRETIEKSRNTIARNSGKPLVLWGILVTVTAFIVWGLWTKTGSPMWNLLWFAMTAIGGVGTHLLTKNNESVPENTLSRMLGKVWMWFGIISTGFYFLIWVAVLICRATGWGVETAGIDFTLIISLLLGLAGAISAEIMDNKAILVSVVVSTVLAVLMSIMLTGPTQILAIAILGVFTLIVPGIILQKTSK